MRIFKAGAKEWVLRIDAPTILDVRAEHKVDLGGVACFDALSADAVLTQQVLWTLCRKQAEASSVSEAAFYEALADGDVGEQASLQLFEAVIDFFPNSQRAGLRKMLATNWEAIQAAGEAVAELIQLETNNGTLKERLLAETRAKLDELFGPLTLPKSATDLLGS